MPRCAMTHLYSWDCDSEVAASALNRRSRFLSRRSGLSFPHTTDIPLLLVAPASAIRGEKQSVPSATAEDVKPAFCGCHFYGESLYHKITDSRSNCWRHKTRQLLATKGCSPMQHFFTTLNSTVDRSKDVQLNSRVRQWDKVTPGQTHQPTNPESHSMGSEFASRGNKVHCKTHE